jgi:exosortase
VKRAEETIASFVKAHAAGLAIAAAGGVILFWPAIRDLARTWAFDPNFSHGFVVPVVAAAILHADRKRLARLRAERSLAGLAFLAASLLVFAAGTTSYTNVLQRLGLWGSLIGSVWFLFGSAVLRAKPFPFLLLLLAIPPPTILFIPFSIALRELASQLAGATLGLLGFDVSRAGSMLTIGENELEVVDACSGIRSLVSIVLIAALLAYLLRSGPWRGLLLMATAVPITVAVNVLRIVLVALGLAAFDVDLSTGVVHAALGVGVFIASILLLYGSWRLYCRIFGWKPREAAS